MPTTDEQLQEKRERNAKLDKELREARAARERDENSAYNDTVAAALDAEAERMQQALDAVRAANGSATAAAAVPAPNPAPAPAATTPAAATAPTAKEGK